MNSQRDVLWTKQITHTDSKGCKELNGEALGRNLSSWSLASLGGIREASDCICLTRKPSGAGGKRKSKRTGRSTHRFNFLGANCVHCVRVRFCFAQVSFLRSR